MKPVAMLALALCAAAPVPARAQIALVADGQAQAVIVVADDPLPIARYAAQELQYHVAKATGVTLDVVAEGKRPPGDRTSVFVGACQAAQGADIDPDGFEPEQSLIRTVGQNLFLVGGDSDGDPLSENTRGGTLFAVYEFLDQVLRVRWLWPGPLGEVVPQTGRVVVPATDRTFAPRFFQRNLRHGLSTRRLRSKPAYTPEGFKRFRHDLRVWLRRQRMGKSKQLRWGHAYNRYWQALGETHPEYFQLLPEHGRGPRSPRSRFSMCVANPELHRVIINLWKRRKHPGTAVNIDLCENDIRGLCECRACRSWDGPDVAPITPRYAYRCVSDRYAQFWKRVHALAQRHDPEIMVCAYAYVNYAPPPQMDVQLDERIIVGLVPDVFFPRLPEQHRWVLDQWEGWARTGARLFLRPNYFLGGYCMPNIFVHQFAEEYDFDVRHNMAATDFDSLTSMFGTQGTNLYYLARKLTRPDWDVDAILAEYYSGFGPAGPQVRDYFDYWERHVTAMRERYWQVRQETKANWSSYPKMCHLLFPAESFAEAGRLLAAARGAAAGHPAALARVEFLHKGLVHAEKCGQVAAAMAGAPWAGKVPSPSRAIQELRHMRAGLQADHIANLNFCVILEDRAFGDIRVTRHNGEALRPLVAEPEEGVELAAIPIRGAQGFVALLGEGERFRARIHCRRVGRYTTPCTWQLFAPDDQAVAKGSIEPKKSADLDMAVATPGTYNLVVDSGRNCGRVTLLNRHAAMLGHDVHLIHGGGPLYVYAPKDLAQFAVTLKTPGPGETAVLTVRDSRGEVMGQQATGGPRTKVAVTVRKPDPKLGAVYSVALSPAPTGVLEDATLRLDLAMPGYWASAPDRLVAPRGE